MDRFKAMTVFARVVEANSFIRAAESLNMPRTSVTTAVQNLERHLNVRLLNRTTRKLSLTPEGEELFLRCKRILSEMDDLDSRFANISHKPRGRLRVDMPAHIGRPLVIPRIHEFTARHPDVELIVGLSDRRIDLVAEGVDCVVRIGELDDSSLISRRIGTYHRSVYASRSYLDRFGEPIEIDDLRRHKAVNYISWRTSRVFPWEFEVDGRIVEVGMRGDIALNDADAYMACATQGLGLIMPSLFMAHQFLRAGSLVEVMARHTIRSMPIHVVYPQNRHLSPKVRIFVDWIAEICSQEPLIGKRRPL